jgi:hypothetical protein
MSPVNESSDPTPTPTVVRNYNAKNQAPIENMYGGVVRVGDENDNSIVINSSYLAQMPENYKNSLVELADTINKEIKKEDIHVGVATLVNDSVNKLAEATTKLNTGEVNREKKETIRERLKGVATALVKMSPKIARTILNVTPLAPFSNLVEEAFNSMVKAALPDSSG